jgi:hypothetical protein
VLYDSKRVRACVRVSVCGWVEQRGSVLACVYPYLSSIQRAAILSSAASLAPPHFSTLSHKRNVVRKKVIEHKTCVLILSTTFI